MTNTKTAQLLHNAESGSAIDKDTLVKLIQANGFKCIYTSLANDTWQLDKTADFVIVAGGDGTVRNVAMRMLADEQYKKPIALLPTGTANNIASSLKITGEPKDIIASWRAWNIQGFDTATVTGLKKPNQLLEGVGFGIFPYLMKRIKEKGTSGGTPEEELEWVQKTMHTIAHEYKGRKCKLKIDGVKYSGKFLLVEVMNVESVGPNLHLNRYADVNDGRLEVVLLPISQRRELIKYLEKKIKGDSAPFDIATTQAQSIEIKWKGKLCHVDDELLTKKKKKWLKVDNKQQLQFLL